MTLSQRLTEYISACFTGLWIESHEHEDALHEIAQLCKQEDWRLATWDIDRGLSVGGVPGDQNADGGTDPLAAIRALNALTGDDSSALLVLVNFHHYMKSPEIIQALAHQIAAGKANRAFVIVLSPLVQIPVELEKQFVVIEHELPSREQLHEIARSIATEDGELPAGDELTAVIDAAAGLTRYEAEGAFSLSITRHNRITPETIWELKGQMLKKSGLLTLHRGSESFASLGGLASVKDFCARAMRRDGQRSKKAQPRGVLLLSPPGCGKSAFAKALGNEMGRPTLVMDVGTLMGSLVGQTESQTRQALRIADAMQPSILFIDEVEKALSGVANGQSDSGVSARMFGNVLTWLNDHDSDVFVVCTANDVSKLPPEFSRAERFDGVFFVDLPSTEERRTIWRLYIEAFELDPNQPKLVDADWTGAEIKSCCRLAALLDVPLLEAAKNVVPVARTSAESVERLRTWASGRCLSANEPGIYQRTTGIAVKPTRKVRRDVSQN
jgi:hypothetical protein